MFRQRLRSANELPQEMPFSAVVSSKLWLNIGEFVCFPEVSGLVMQTWSRQLALFKYF